MDANCLLLGMAAPDAPWLYHDSMWWSAFGYLGQGVFASRFLVQWLLSEHKKQLVVPPIFWHLSFWGSLITLIYALHVGKGPFILGSVFLPFLYGRNLMLLYRKKETASQPKSETTNNQE